MQSIRHDFSKATGYDSLTAFKFILTVIFFLLQDDCDRRKRLQAQELLTGQQNAQIRQRRILRPPAP